MKKSFYYLCFGMLLSLASPTTATDDILKRSSRGEITSVEENDPAMRLAFSRAKATLPQFTTLLERPNADQSDFAVKVGFSDTKNTEFFWIGRLTRDDRTWFGTVSNPARSINTVQLGQRITFSEDQIVDWMYMESGSMKGNFTACALLTHESASSSQAFRNKYRLDCPG